MTMDSLNWRKIIWREWLHTVDTEIATHLWRLIADRPPIEGRIIALLIGTGAIYGLLAGLLVGLILTLRSGWPVDFSIITQAIMGSGIIGAILGLLAWALLLKQLNWSALFDGIKVGFLVGLLFGIIHPLSGVVAGVTAGIVWAKDWLKLEKPTSFIELGPAITALTGCLIVPSLGLGLDIIGLLVLETVLIYVSGGLYHFFKVKTGFLFHQERPSASIPWIPRLLPVRDNTQSSLAEYLFRFHGWVNLLGLKSPPMAEVEAALAIAIQVQHGTQPDWARMLRRLKNKKKRLVPPIGRLIHDLQANWETRLATQIALVEAGGEAITSLRQLLAQDIPELKLITLDLLHRISRETNWRWAAQAHNLVCPTCLVQCHAHPLSQFGLSGQVYYGCRNCRQSRTFLSTPQGVVAVFDQHWKEKTDYHAGQLRVNALMCSSLFDFNQIEISCATDQQVERFAVRMGNDTDPVRQAIYPQVICVIASDCQISENSRRILQSLFGSNLRDRHS